MKNELDIFDKKMTVEEVASVFELSHEAIKKWIRELFPDKMKNGVKTLLTEEEVTIIKLKLRPTTKVVANKTQLEKNLLIQQAFGFLKEQEESLRLELTEAKKQLTLQAPKVKLAEECIRDKDKHYSITNAGKQLGLKRTFIFNLMIEKHLLTSEKLPTQHALNRDFISLRTNTIGGKNYPQAVMTMENIYNFKKSYEKDFINGSV